MEPIVIECPVCQAELEVEDVAEGQLIECDACHAVVEVMSVKPLELMLVEAGEGRSVECPRCGTVFTSYDVEIAVCPECGYTVRLNEEEEDWE